MENLPYVAGNSIPTCGPHGRRTCYQCLHSFNCDTDGEYHEKVQYGCMASKRTAIYTGKHALFIPQLDSHLGLTAGVELDNSEANWLILEEIVTLRSLEIVKPPPVAPDKRWFYYCEDCELTWMSGFEGITAAATHPSHVAIRDERTLACWVGVQTPKLDSTSAHCACYQFGHGSKYNGCDERKEYGEALVAAILTVLRKARLEIHQDRCSAILGSVRTNSGMFLEKAQLFRLVVLVSDPNLVSFLTALRTCL
jgi:hypothetical protein